MMKKILFVIGIGLTLLFACNSVKTLSTGLESESFLEFIGKPRTYSGGVSVVVDDKNAFKAEVSKSRANRTKSKVYAISTGKHTVSVSFNNNLIFKKQIFVSAQETKKIILP